MNARTKCYAQKIHAREVRVDKQYVAFESKLITICTEISHSHSVARTCWRVAHDQVGIAPESCTESLCGEYQEKKKTHAQHEYRGAAPIAKSAVATKEAN